MDKSNIPHVEKIDGRLSIIEKDSGRREDYFRTSDMFRFTIDPKDSMRPIGCLSILETSGPDADIAIVRELRAKGKIPRLTVWSRDDQDCDVDKQVQPWVVEITQPGWMTNSVSVFMRPYVGDIAARVRHFEGTRAKDPHCYPTDIDEFLALNKKTADYFDVTMRVSGAPPDQVWNNGWSLGDLCIEIALPAKLFDELFERAMVGGIENISVGVRFLNLYGIPKPTRLNSGAVADDGEVEDRDTWLAAPAADGSLGKIEVVVGKLGLFEISMKIS